MEDKLYKILFDKSTVDGVRIIHEDEWPIDELLALFTQSVEEAKIEQIKEIQEEFNHTFVTTDVDLTKRFTDKLKARLATLIKQ